MKKITILLLVLLAFNCSTKDRANLIVTNINIYTVNDNFDKAQAFAVKDLKFLEVRTAEAIASKYEATETVDAEEQSIVLGFTHDLIFKINEFVNLGFRRNNKKRLT